MATKSSLRFIAEWIDTERLEEIAKRYGWNKKQKTPIEEIIEPVSACRMKTFPSFETARGWMLKNLDEKTKKSWKIFIQHKNDEKEWETAREFWMKKTGANTFESGGDNSIKNTIF